MNRDNIADLRLNYTRGDLLEEQADSDPFLQFKRWFEQAREANILEPNAMTLATINSDGYPSARIVLLKGLDDAGFIFYTNYHSEKAQQIAANPWGALVFWWGVLERQVRVEGKIEQISPELSDSYFQSRPRDSQLGTWASPQSQIIADRTVLENYWQEVKTKYEDTEIPRPPHWGGYRLTPKLIEFWQGRSSRLHDRLRYRLQENNTWVRERLAP